MTKPREIDHAPERLRGRIALVTGAAGGIGHAICARLAADGAELILVDVDERVAEVAADLPGARFTVLDHSDEDAVTGFLRGVEALDILVSNAGRSTPNGLLVDSKRETFEDLLSANLIGHYVMVKKCAALLQAAPSGVVVITASISGRRAQRGAGMYGATKAALLHLARTFALELAPGRVLTVSPGIVDTPMLRLMIGDIVDQGPPPGLIPLGDLCSAEDVAATVSFAVSSDARHMTATDLLVDGGIHAGL